MSLKANLLHIERGLKDSYFGESECQCLTMAAQSITEY